MSNTWQLITALHAARQLPPLNEMPGLWIEQIDERWFMAINGGREPRQEPGGFAVPPFHCYVKFNGWPAGLFDYQGGQFAAGELANLESFHAALTRAQDAPARPSPLP